MQRKFTFLSLCVTASILVGAVSFVKAETTLPESGWNYVDVASCEQIGTSIKIKRVATDTYYSTLTSECRDAGYGLQDLGMECVSRTRYKASWKPCGSTVLTQEIESLGVYNGATGAQIEGLSNASYVKMNKSYWAKQLVTVPASLDSFKIKLNAVSNLPRGNYSYAFSWVDSNTGSTNFQESLAKTLVSGSNFGSNNYVNFSVTDYYRGKWVTMLAFMKNNDGVSQVVNMPVEVDDVIALHIYIPVKESAPVAPVVSASGYKISAFDLYDHDTSTYLWQSTYSYQSFKGYLGTSIYYIGNSIKNIQYRVNSNVVLGDSSYAIRALTSSDGITQFNENNVQDWAKDLTFVRGSIMNLSVDDKRGKWVTAFAYVRNNDGKSDVPNMPVEVDDVIALNLFVTTMRETTPEATIPRTITPTPEPTPTPTSPVIPANNLPACSDIKGGDTTFLVCQGYTADHYWSGTKVRINEHDGDVAEVDLDGVNEDSATLAKGESETFDVTNKPGKYITVTYLGLGAGSRALVKISSNTTYEESITECVDNIGGDGTYTLCPKKKFVHNVSGITLTNKLNNGSYVLLGANGANLKNYKVKYKRSAVITSKINGAKISVTYNTNKRAEGVVITIKTTNRQKKLLQLLNLNPNRLLSKNKIIIMLMSPVANKLALA